MESFRLLRSNNSAADFNENLGLVTVAQILCQRLENYRILDLIKQLLVDFGSKSFALYSAQKYVATAGLHTEGSRHTSFVKYAAAIGQNVAIQIEVADQHLALMRGLWQISAFRKRL
jgi:hypothetical protein